MRLRRMTCFAYLVVWLTGAGPAAAQTPAPAVEAATAPAPAAAPAALDAKNSKVWVGREAEFEQYLLNTEFERYEDIPVGVTKPVRGFFPQGGLVSSAAFKSLQPNRAAGYFESYKAEIAAYKLDLMLDMHMVPPIVERKIDGMTGAAIYWVDNVTGWSVAKPPQGPEPMWSRQLTRMKMFDLLIANIDRNQGNLIYDADWHLILIDHSRAFIDKKDLKGIAPLGRVDRQLWEKMQALTMEDLDRGLEKWVGEREKKALLLRRDLMATNIQQLVAKSGEKFVFYD